MNARQKLNRYIEQLRRERNTTVAGGLFAFNSPSWQGFAQTDATSTSGNEFYARISESADVQRYNLTGLSNGDAYEWVAVQPDTGNVGKFIDLPSQIGRLTDGTAGISLDGRCGLRPNTIIRITPWTDDNGDTYNFFRVASPANPPLTVGLDVGMAVDKAILTISPSPPSSVVYPPKTLQVTLTILDTPPSYWPPARQSFLASGLNWPALFNYNGQAMTPWLTSGGTFTVTMSGYGYGNYIYHGPFQKVVTDSSGNVLSVVKPPIPIPWLFSTNGTPTIYNPYSLGVYVWTAPVGVSLGPTQAGVITVSNFAGFINAYIGQILMEQLVFAPNPLPFSPYDGYQNGDNLPGLISINGPSIFSPPSPGGNITWIGAYNGSDYPIYSCHGWTVQLDVSGIPGVPTQTFIQTLAQ